MTTPDPLSGPVEVSPPRRRWYLASWATVALAALLVASFIALAIVPLLLACLGLAIVIIYAACRQYDRMPLVALTLSLISFGAWFQVAMCEDRITGAIGIMTMVLGTWLSIRSIIMVKTPDRVLGAAAIMIAVLGWWFVLYRLLTMTDNDWIVTRVFWGLQ